MPSESCRFVFASVHTSRRFTIFGESSFVLVRSGLESSQLRSTTGTDTGRPPAARAGAELASRSRPVTCSGVMFYGC